MMTNSSRSNTNTQHSRKLNAWRRRRNARRQNANQIQIIGDDTERKITSYTTPNQLMIFEKEIRNVSCEYGKIFSAESVRAALTRHINDRIESADKLSLHEVLGNTIETEEIVVTRHVYTEEFEFRGKFLNKFATKTTLNRLENLILTFSKLEISSVVNDEHLDIRNAILIDEDLSPQWKSEMIPKIKMKVSNVVEHVQKIIEENFVIDMKIQCTTIGKDRFISIGYKPIRRTKLNLAKVSYFKKISESKKTMGFNILKNIKTANHY